MKQLPAAERESDADDGREERAEEEEPPTHHEDVLVAPVRAVLDTVLHLQ